MGYQYLNEKAANRVLLAKEEEAKKQIRESERWQAIIRGICPDCGEYLVRFKSGFWMQMLGPYDYEDRCECGFVYKGNYGRMP
jgi:ssDNA-binding Zn-finger/Zn-ribbon topoisomerase 1